jgi:hypothetical protein
VVGTDADAMTECGTYDCALRRACQDRYGAQPALCLEAIRAAGHCVVENREGNLVLFVESPTVDMQAAETLRELQLSTICGKLGWHRHHSIQIS